MSLPVEEPEIVTVQIVTPAGDVREVPLTRAEYDEIVAEADVRGFSVEFWLKEKMLAAADAANTRPEGVPVIADKRGLS